MMKRSKNLTDGDVDQIVSIIDGWGGKLSWDGLLTAIEVRSGQSYTRQALSKHVRILEAFQIRKRGLANQQRAEPFPTSSPELNAALQRIARLEAITLRLEAERVTLLDQFARWAYNAHLRGLTHDFLNRPLPPVDRDQTKVLPTADIRKRTKP